MLLNLPVVLFDWLKERIIGSFISEVTAFLENSPKYQFYKHM
jgi:hypothetical protein